MKVLFCHNYYRYRGGEDQSFESEVEMLRDKGVEVITYCVSNSDIADTIGGKTRTLVKTIYSRSARQAVGSLIEKHSPDVLHCNNLFPQLSTSVYGPAVRAGVPIVQAIRNYRTFCANAFFYRDERVCTDCLKSRASFASIRHGCYRGSRAASAVVTAMQLVQRTVDRVRSPVSLYFTPTEFARQTLISGGFEPNLIRVKPNFIHPDPGVCTEGDVTSAHSQRGFDQFVFVGRLSPEKGLRTLLDAWKDLSVPLSIVGDGPMRAEIEEYSQNHSMVTFHGEQPHDEVIRILGRSKCLIMPSLWFETFGRAIAESFSRGTPVIASQLGAMAELVDDGSNGYLFQPGEPRELKSAVKRVCDLGERQYHAMRISARKSFEQSYSRDINFEKLMRIYAEAMESSPQ